MHSEEQALHGGSVARGTLRSAGGEGQDLLAVGCLQNSARFQAFGL